MVGVVVAFAFALIEARVSRLIKASESALARSEKALAGATGISELDLVSEVEDKEVHWKKYSRAISVVQWTFGVAFALGAGYALYLCL